MIQHYLSDQSTPRQDYFQVLRPPSYHRRRRHIRHLICTHLPLTPRNTLPTATTRRTTTSWATSSPATTNTARQTITTPPLHHGTVVTLALVLPSDMHSHPAATAAVAYKGRTWQHQAEEEVEVGTCHCNIWILHRTIGFKMGSKHVFEKKCK